MGWQCRAPSFASICEPDRHGQNRRVVIDEKCWHDAIHWEQCPMNRQTTLEHPSLHTGRPLEASLRLDGYLPACPWHN